MSVGTNNSLKQAAEELGVSRNLVAFLVRHYGIPVVLDGPSRRLTDDGMDRLRELVAEHQSKPPLILAS